jgi:hypothetical protein
MGIMVAHDEDFSQKWGFMVVYGVLGATLKIISSHPKLRWM